MLLWKYTIQNAKLKKVACNISLSQQNDDTFGNLASDGYDMLRGIANQQLEDQPEMANIVVSNSFLSSLLMRSWREINHEYKKSLIFEDNATDFKYFTHLHEFYEDFCFKANHKAEKHFYLPCYKAPDGVIEAVHVPQSATTIVASLSRAISLDLGGTSDFVASKFARDIYHFIILYPKLRDPIAAIQEQKSSKKYNCEFDQVVILQRGTPDDVFFEAVNNEKDKQVIGRGRTESETRSMAAIYYLENYFDERWPSLLEWPIWLKKESGLGIWRLEIEKLKKEIMAK